MHARAGAKDLARAVKFAGEATPARTTIPIVGDLRIEVGAATLTVSGTDLDHEHRVTIPATDCEPGAVTVPAARMALVNKLPATAAVTLKSEDDRCAISSGRGRWTLPSLNPDDWPVIKPVGDDAVSFRLSAAEATRLATRLEHAISTEEIRYYLNGIYMHREGDRLCAVAANGHVLASILIDIDPGYDLGVIIPKKVIETLADLDGDIDVRVDCCKIELTCGDQYIISKLIDATYPDYARVIPAPSGEQVTVDIADLIASIERHKAAAEHRPTIGLTWSDGTLTTYLSDEEHAVEDPRNPRKQQRRQTMPYDYSEAPAQPERELIPAGTVATVQMRIRAGGVGEDGMCKRSEKGSEMLDVEYVVLDGPHKRRKFWGYLLVDGITEDQKAVADSHKRLRRAILESSRGIKPLDMSPQARTARTASLREFDGIPFIGKIDIEKGKPKNNGSGENWPDKNILVGAVTPDDPSWHPVEQPPPFHGEDSGARVAPSASSSSALPAPGISKPSWAS
jgi:DNA polymerase-3 subunit beta